MFRDGCDWDVGVDVDVDWDVDWGVDWDLDWDVDVDVDLDVGVGVVSSVMMPRARNSLERGMLTVDQRWDRAGRVEFEGMTRPA